MADLKFACPECQQRILVDDSAAGVQIDCPTCRSSVVIPARASDPVQIVKRRRLVVATTSTGAGDDALEQKQKALATALGESKRLRDEAESATRELAKLRADLQTAAAERDGLRATGEQTGVELNRLKTGENWFKTELDKARAAATDAQKRVGALELDLAAKVKTLTDAQGAQSELAKLRGDMVKLGTERDAAQSAAEKALQELKLVAVRPATTAPLADDGKLRALESQLADLRTQLEAARRTASEPSGEVRAQLQKLQGTLAAVTAERDRLKTAGGAELTTLRTELDTAKNNFDVQQKKLRDLGESFAKSERERIELQRKLSDAGPAQELTALRGKLVALQSQLADSQNTMLTFRGERDKVRQQLAEREEAFQKTSSTTDTARAESERVRQEAAAEQERLQTALAAATKHAAELQSRIDGLLGNLEVRARDLGEARAQLTAKETALTEHAAKIAALRTESESFQKSLAAATATHAKTQTESSTAHEQAKTAAAAATERANSLQLRAETSEKELAAARTDLDALRKAESALRLDFKAITERANAAEQRLKSLETDFAKRSEELEHRAENLVTDLRLRTTELAEAQKNLGLARTERETALSAATARDKEFREISSQHSTATSRVTELQKRVETLTADLTKTNTALETERNERESAAKQLAAREVEVRDLTGQIAKVKTSELSLRVQVQTLETGLAPMQEKVRMVEAERDRLKMNFDKVNTEIEGATTLSQQAKIDQETAKMSVKEMTRQLDQTLDRVRDLEGERDRLREEVDGIKQGLDRSKQHINTLQSRRDQMREEIAKLKVKLGLAPDAVA